MNFPLEFLTGGQRRAVWGWRCHDFNNQCCVCVLPCGMCSRADGATVFVCEYVCLSVVLFLRVHMGSTCLHYHISFIFNACVSLYGKTWWFSPTLTSVTANGVDKCNDRVRMLIGQTVTKKSYCFPCSSSLLVLFLVFPLVFSTLSLLSLTSSFLSCLVKKLIT